MRRVCKLIYTHGVAFLVHKTKTNIYLLKKTRCKFSHLWFATNIGSCSYPPYFRPPDLNPEKGHLEWKACGSTLLCRSENDNTISSYAIAKLPPSELKKSTVDKFKTCPLFGAIFQSVLMCFDSNLSLIEAEHTKQSLQPLAARNGLSPLVNFSWRLS